MTKIITLADGSYKVINMSTASNTGAMLASKAPTSASIASKVLPLAGPIGLAVGAGVEAALYYNETGLVYDLMN